MLFWIITVVGSLIAIAAIVAVVLAWFDRNTD